MIAHLEVVGKISHGRLLAGLQTGREREETPDGTAGEVQAPEAEQGYHEASTSSFGSTTSASASSVGVMRRSDGSSRSRVR